MAYSSEVNADSLTEFIHAACEVCVEYDREYTFTCTNCGSEAYAEKTSHNGHHRGHCTNCWIRFIE